jgi:hypothetical protein
MPTGTPSPTKKLRPQLFWREGPVLIMASTQNAKLGACSATYVSQQTCPTTCPLLHAGCYAEYNPRGAGQVTRALNRVEGYTNADVAAIEAQGITALGALRSGRKLRVHVVGDCPDGASADRVGDAMARYTAGVGRPAWTYTHAWRDVERRAWGGAEVLASCETPAGVEEAWERGYAAALVVPAFPSPRAYVQDGVTVLPCPNQVTQGRVTCDACHICMQSERLRHKRLAVGFEAHGGAVGKPKVVRLLTALNAQAAGDRR